MSHVIRYFTLLGAFQLLLSCGNEATTASADGGQPQAAYRVKSGEMFDDDSDKILGRYGSTNSDGAAGKGPASEGAKVNENFNGAYSKREFQGKNYDKKSFWGKKDYAKQVYSGSTDGSGFRQGAREGSQWAKEGAVVSDESGRSFNKGRDFGGLANEASQSRISRPSDAKVDNRRAVYKQPKVEDVQRKRALSVEDTRSMLGR